MRNRFSFAAAILLAVAVAFAAAMPAVSQAPDSTPSAGAPQNPSQSAPPSTAAPQQNNAPAPNAAPPQAPSSSNTQSQSSQDENPLGLTEDQKTQLRPIVTEETQQMEAVRNDNSLSQEQKIAKINQIREAASPKIKAILTPEQLQKLADMQRARQQQEQAAPQR
jgi:periplasmic protein CpxP/Spy